MTFGSKALTDADLVHHPLIYATHHSMINMGFENSAHSGF